MCPQNINSSINYDKKRKDITFCTMLFQIPTPGNLDSLKRMDRKFENFYLPSLQRLIDTFERVALWCDPQTAQFLTDRGLDKQIMMKVMQFQDLPHYAEREEWLKILNKMTKHVGYLLHRKTPEQWIDYMILIAAKPAVIYWAAKNNKFNSDYFMWIDAGCFNTIYRGFWDGWSADGRIDACPDRCRFTIAPTLGKSRPHFVPKPLYLIWQKFKPAIQPATATRLARQSLTDIAMINADYDVPATSFIIPNKWASKFYEQFETVRKIMMRHSLVSTEQAVFQAMMKFDTYNMFELSYIRGYAGVYTAVAAAHPDHLL